MKLSPAVIAVSNNVLALCQIMIFALTTLPAYVAIKHLNVIFAKQFPVASFLVLALCVIGNDQSIALVSDLHLDSTAYAYANQNVMSLVIILATVAVKDKRKSYVVSSNLLSQLTRMYHWVLDASVVCAVVVKKNLGKRQPATSLHTY